jgi:hypothetical protein
MSGTENEKNAVSGGDRALTFREASELYVIPEHTDKYNERINGDN